MKKNVFRWIFILVLVGFAFSFGISSLMYRADSVELSNATSCFPTISSGANEFKIFDLFDDNLSGFVFQIIFILFFISPPLIVVLLFLIWKEMKERNRLK